MTNPILKVHYTCRHSDKHDYSCGDCIKESNKRVALAVLGSVKEPEEGQLVDDSVSYGFRLGIAAYRKAIDDEKERWK